MNELSFIAVGLGLLAFLEKRNKEAVSLKNFSDFIKDGLEIFAASALLSMICYGGLQALPWSPIRKNEFFILLLLPLSYVWHAMQKKSWTTYLIVTAFSLFAVEKSRSFWGCVYTSAWLSGAATLFQFLLQGLRSRLVLTPVPRNVEGLPLLFFVAAVIALILNAFFWMG